MTMASLISPTRSDERTMVSFLPADLESTDEEIDYPTTDDDDNVTTTARATSAIDTHNFLV